jgi:hypothetical protein
MAGRPYSHRYSHRTGTVRAGAHGTLNPKPQTLIRASSARALESERDEKQIMIHEAQGMVRNNMRRAERKRARWARGGRGVQSVGLRDGFRVWGLAGGGVREVQGLAPTAACSMEGDGEEGV